MKLRVDKLLVERGLCQSRTRAQERIESGDVLIDGNRVSRVSMQVDANSSIEMRGTGPLYVSRGGLKLARALDHWKIDLAGRNCLDIGISTGGFTDCMLQRRAAAVIGVDSGHSQLHLALVKDPRVRVLEGTNARYLEPSMLSLEISFVAVDVSFIAASVVLPAVISSAFPKRGVQPAGAEAIPNEAVILVKPQFEAGREFVGKHGLVVSEAAHGLAIERVTAAVLALGAGPVETIESPIRGGDGNREFLLYARFRREAACR